MKADSRSRRHEEAPEEGDAKSCRFSFRACGAFPEERALLERLEQMVEGRRSGYVRDLLLRGLQAPSSTLPAARGPMGAGSTPTAISERRVYFSLSPRLDDERTALVHLQSLPRTARRDLMKLWVMTGFRLAKNGQGPSVQPMGVVPTGSSDVVQKRHDLPSALSIHEERQSLKVNDIGALDNGLGPLIANSQRVFQGDPVAIDRHSGKSEAAALRSLMGVFGGTVPPAGRNAP